MNKEQFSAYLEKWLVQHQSEMVQELMDWVRIPSVSRADLSDNEKKQPYGPDVRAMLDHALNRGRELGFEAEDHDGYCGSICYGTGSEEIGIVAHLDVVPEGGGWVYSPYQPVVVDGFMVGRGCADNKAAGVMGLYLMRLFRAAGISMTKTLRLMMGCAEETGMDDFRHYVAEGGKVPAMSLVADAGFPVCYAQKGRWTADIRIPAGNNVVDLEAGNVRNAIPDTARVLLKGITLEEVKEALKDSETCEVQEADGLILVTAHGKGGHAAGPDGTLNAITLLARTLSNSEVAEKIDLGCLKWIADTFESPCGEGMGFAFEDEITGKLTSNIGVTHTKNGWIRALLDIRYPVTMPITENSDAFCRYLASSGVLLDNLEMSKPFYIDKDDEKVQTLMRAYREVTGDTREAYTMGGCTYSKAIPNAITFGPGLPYEKPDFLPAGHGSAHGPDEVLHLEGWFKAFRIYALAIFGLL